MSHVLKYTHYHNDKIHIRKTANPSEILAYVCQSLDISHAIRDYPDFKKSVLHLLASFQQLNERDILHLIQLNDLINKKWPSINQPPAIFKNSDFLTDIINKIPDLVYYTFCKKDQKNYNKLEELYRQYFYGDNLEKKDIFHDTILSKLNSICATTVHTKEILQLHLLQESPYSTQDIDSLHVLFKRQPKLFSKDVLIKLNNKITNDYNPSTHSLKYAYSFFHRELCSDIITYNPKIIDTAFEKKLWSWFKYLDEPQFLQVIDKLHNIHNSPLNSTIVIQSIIPEKIENFSITTLQKINALHFNPKISFLIEATLLDQTIHKNNNARPHKI